MAEPIEMPFGLLARMGPRNHVLDGGPVTTWEGAILGKGSPIVKYRGLLNRSISFWVVDSGVPKEAQVQSYSSLIMVALCNRADHYIFILFLSFFLSFFLLFFSSPNLSSRRLEVYHTSAHGVVLV